MLANNVELHTINISNTFILHVKSAHTKYEEYLQKSQHQKQKEASNKQKQILAKEIRA